MNLLGKTTTILAMAAMAYLASSCAPSQAQQARQPNTDNQHNYLEDIAQQKNASLEQAQKKVSRPFQSN